MIRSSLASFKDAGLEDGINLLVADVSLTIVNYLMPKVVDYVLTRIEAQSELEYDTRSARVIAGLITVFMNTFHTRPGDLVIDTRKGPRLIGVFPHRTGVEALVVATKIKGNPPRYCATNAFNAIPGMAPFLEKFKVIPVAANAKKDKAGRSANQDALDTASQGLENGDCIVLFPQGNFSRRGQEPYRVYEGIVKLALKHSIPIDIVRVDGDFWSLENPLIPLSVRNHVFYRGLATLFHPNNIQTNLCGQVDYHLKPENQHMKEAQLIEEMCAQLYAYGRHTETLTPHQIYGIQQEIIRGTHLEIWRDKLLKDNRAKVFTALEKGEFKLSAKHRLFKPVLEDIRERGAQHQDAEQGVRQESVAASPQIG